jgi:lysophospholipase L1-like esterase
VVTAASDVAHDTHEEDVMTRLRPIFSAFLTLGLVVAAAASGARAATAAEFPLRDGQTWVMAGDSITAQHLHSNYFEAFCFARYPQLTFRFRNSGVSGDTVPKLLARFDWDVAGWKPQIVSVELGMNDQGGYNVQQYLSNMSQLGDRIRSAGAEPVWLTSSPINNGGTSPDYVGNAKLHDFALALKDFAAKQDAPFADQFHALVDLWGRNKPRENLANMINQMTPLAKDDKLTGVEHLRAFLAAQEADGSPKVSLMGDPVHPGPTGQLTMAAALLKQLGAASFVSSAELTADGKVTAAKDCTIEQVTSADKSLSFTRLDARLPFPIPDDARAVLTLDPTVLAMSDYGLKVTGLADDAYEIQVNGASIGTATGRELAAGVNLTKFSQGAIAAQGKAILAAVSAKENQVSQWRGLSRMAVSPDTSGNVKEQLAVVTRNVEAADAKIREAAKPVALEFRIVPVN